MKREESATIETKVETKPTFERAFNQLKVGDRIMVTKLIMEQNKWSQPLFTMKKLGDRALTQIEWDVVTTAFRLMGLDALTGNPSGHEKQ